MGRSRGRWQPSGVAAGRAGVRAHGSGQVVTARGTGEHPKRGTRQAAKPFARRASAPRNPPDHEERDCPGAGPPGRMTVELVGDSAESGMPRRASSWTAGASSNEDAPGMARSLVGLTLLEAAAVPVRCLPRTRWRTRSRRWLPPAQASRGSGDERRCRQRGRSPSSRTRAVGVTLRLWLDPRGPDASACCRPTRSSAPGTRATRSACRT
jgi:hypothetical protein